MAREYKDRVSSAVGDTASGPQYERWSGVYFFLSLDLVNSTAYKANNADWKYRIRMFYDEAKDYWRNRSTSFSPRVWKYAGDEVLFYAKVESVRQLEDALASSYDALKTVSGTVKAWTASASPTLLVKGTCWCAYAEYHKPSPESELPRTETEPSRNIVFQSPFGVEQALQALEFLGPEIDAGFRISAGSIKNALVVSAELADLCRRRGSREQGDRLRIVDYRELKGVWDGRRYPIVWYRRDWSAQALDADYDYDDRFRFDILNKAYGAKDDSADQLASILRQVRRGWLERQDMPTDPPRAAVDEPNEAVLVAPEMEVHAVAVCFRSDGRVLVARRSPTKLVFPGRWEAGCSRMRVGDDFITSLKRDYLTDLGLQLDFGRFSKWGTVGTYSFEKRGRVVPGVIFVADVTNPDALSISKHAEAKWVDPKALPEDVVSNCVPDLPERIARARKIWEDG